ncbi:hypothetical protein QUA13_01360 [Microcoleus sp. S28C3]|uniref:hypothetical protein n=1 Tax=Microcoleus sp. S28C3 TaxID=3055414 RepID=UPI002FCF2A42
MGDRATASSRSPVLRFLDFRLDISQGEPGELRAIALEILKLLKLPAVMALGEFWC